MSQKRDLPYYSGRLDIRYNTLDELKPGNNFSIIELNGAGSEPTHIYDPTHFVFFCLERNNQAPASFVLYKREKSSTWTPAYVFEIGIKNA